MEDTICSSSKIFFIHGICRYLSQLIKQPNSSASSTPTEDFHTLHTGGTSEESGLMEIDSDAKDEIPRTDHHKYVLEILYFFCNSTYNFFMVYKFGVDFFAFHSTIKYQMDIVVIYSGLADKLQLIINQWFLQFLFVICSTQSLVEIRSADFIMEEMDNEDDYPVIKKEPTENDIELQPTHLKTINVNIPTTNTQNIQSDLMEIKSEIVEEDANTISECAETSAQTSAHSPKTGKF